MKFYKFIVCCGFLSISIFLLADKTSGQDFEYGKPDELKGLTTYSVDTAGDVDIRNRIIEVVGKELPMLTLKEESDEAQIRLTYMGKGSSYKMGAGFVTVDAKGADKTRPRVIVSFQNEQDNKGETKPHNKFSKAFIKAYKKANGLK